MARPTTAARRYAEAAFQIASRDNSLDAWSRDLAVVAELLSDERVTSVLDNPALPLAERERTVRELFGNRVSPEALNLIQLLTDRRRAEIAPAIASEFRRLVNRQRGVVEAVVTSAQPLTTDETEALRRRVEEMAATSVDLRTQVDPSLIGGLTVEVGGRLLDASVRGRLERLRSELVAGTRVR